MEDQPTETAGPSPTNAAPSATSAEPPMSVPIEPEGPPATLVDTIHAGNGNVLRFYRGASGEVQIVETGAMSGSGSYLKGSRAKSAAALWRALAPDRPVPLAVLADEQEVLRLINVNSKRKLAELPPAILAIGKSDCSCSAAKSAGEPQGPYCWLNMTSSATFQSHDIVDWILGEAAICNKPTSSGAIRARIQYRSWWSWSTLFDGDLPPGHWVYYWRYSPNLDFDWRSSGTVTSSATWDMVNSGGIRCIPGHNWCANGCGGC